MSLRCDNTACIAMMDEPGWRTRYISIYGEAARQEILQGTMILTYVSSDRQLADPLTKPTSSFTGPNFIHPDPPTPESTLLGVGGV